MIHSWTKEDIEAIMIQLNNQHFPFEKYEFAALGAGMRMLGSGASANVYEAFAKNKKDNKFAIKVIGFGDKHVDSVAFRHSVEAQTNLGYSENNIVKIFDSIELRVWIEGEHEVVKAEMIDSDEGQKPEGNYLHLQFILMEKISPVLESFRWNHKLIPYKLAIYDESEIIKLAYEIGLAISKAHKNNLIHRDIKLENIFYDAKGQHYKLGDFGISRTTDAGMASTVAFTKGYGAPEVVGTLDDKYDYTADIYSLGMTLYVLLNEMRFPESNGYHPTVYQYVHGYIPPEPLNGSDELIKVVLKMLSFNPDDRYQSMDEVLNAFDRLKFGRRLKYQREHKSAALTLGTVFALMGACVWKLSFMPDIQPDFGLWEYIFCSLCICKTVLYIFKKNTIPVSTVIFVVGSYVMLLSGFTWWKPIVLLVTAFSNYWVGIVGGCTVISNVTYSIMEHESFGVKDFARYRWTAVLLISLSVLLLVLHAVLEERDEKITQAYMRKNMFWIVATLLYVFLIPIERVIEMAQEMPVPIYDRLLGSNAIEWILSWNPTMVGICGAGFCLLWIIREWFLLFIEKQYEKGKSEEQYSV